MGGGGFSCKQPVNPVSQLHRLLERHQVDIARPLPQRRRNDHVDQIDDRRLVRHHLDVVQRPALRADRMLRVEILDHLLNRHLVALRHLLQDLGHRGFKFLHLQAAQQPDIFDHPLVAGFGGRDLNRAVVQADGENPMPFYELQRQRPNRLGGHFELAQTAQSSARHARSEDTLGILDGLNQTILRICVGLAHSSIDFGGFLTKSAPTSLLTWFRLIK